MAKRKYVYAMILGRMTLCEVMPPPKVKPEVKPKPQPKPRPEPTP